MLKFNSMSKNDGKSLFELLNPPTQKEYGLFFKCRQSEFLIRPCSLVPCLLLIDYHFFALYFAWNSTAHDQLFFPRVIITLYAVLFHLVLVGQPFQMCIILVYLS